MLNASHRIQSLPKPCDGLQAGPGNFENDAGRHPKGNTLARPSYSYEKRRKEQAKKKKKEAKREEKRLRKLAANAPPEADAPADATADATGDAPTDAPGEVMEDS